MPKSENQKQDIQIAQLQKDIDYIKQEISVIKNQVFNGIPHSIKIVEDNLAAFKLNNSRWLIGILVSLIFLLIGTVLKLFIR
jgi:hypothetical protein